MRAELNCWGPYRSVIEERLVACEDSLGRLRRSFTGEIAPDRFYFGDKACAMRRRHSSTGSTTSTGGSASAAPESPERTSRSAGARRVTPAHTRPPPAAGSSASSPRPDAWPPPSAA